MNAEDCILVIHPDRQTREALGQALERAGYRVTCVAAMADARRVVERYGPPQVILCTGEHWPERLTLGGQPAVIQLVRWAQDGPAEAAHATAVDGADEYIAWPASDEEVVARVRRAQRAAERGDATTTGREHGDDLGGREAALLALLRRHENRVLSADFLLGQVWGDGLVGPGTLRVAIHRLRQRLAAEAARDGAGAGVIQSVRGRGYIYTATAATGAVPSAGVADGRATTAVV